MAVTLRYLALLAALLCAADAQAARRMGPAQPGLVRLVQTAKDTGDRLSDKAPLRFAAPGDAAFAARPPAQVVIAVDRRVRYQEVFGFGGAFTEAAALTIAQMKPELQAEILDAYYGPDGIQYNIGRVPIGSCDFSTKTYTYNDYADDFSMSNFSLSAGPDDSLIIPLIKRARLLRSRSGKVDFPTDFSRDDSVRLFASPWSPPAWMKKNGKSETSSFPDGLKPGDEYMSAYALYFSKFLAAYRERGVDFWAVTCQNEPLASVKWESCSMAPNTERDFVKKHLGPTLAKEHPGVKIIIGDDQKLDLGLYTSAILDDPEARKYVSGAGVHWYTGDNFWALERAHEKHPDIFLLGTEACEGYLPWARGVSLGNWKRGEHYGHDILGDLNHFANGWTDWNLVLNEKGGPNHLGNFCDALIIADTVQQKLTYQPSFYYMAHFSKFLPRGSFRVKSDEVSRSFSLTPPKIGPSKIISSIARDVLAQQNGGVSRMVVQSAEDAEEAVLISAGEGSANPEGFSIAGLGDSGLEYGAFTTPDGETVLIVLNRNDKEYEVEVEDAGYRARASVPARSIQTWIYQHPDTA